MKYKIVADSSCDLRSYTSCREVSYSAVPLKIRVGPREFTDNAALDTRAMMDAMHNFNGPTSSACPSPEEWAAEFLQADCCLAVTITSGLSGSCNSARVARDMVLEGSPRKKESRIVDSLSASGELVLIVQKAIQLLEEGLPFEEVCRQADLYAQKYQLLFALANFDNLVKNGRMSRLVGFVAGAMNMRAVGTASKKGTLEVLHKTRGETRALAFILEEMARRGFTGGPVVISHCFNENGAQMLRRGILAKWPESRVEVFPTSGLCSYYAEEEGILVGF